MKKATSKAKKDILKDKQNNMSDNIEEKTSKLWKKSRDNGISIALFVLLAFILLFNALTSSTVLFSIYSTALISAILMAVGCSKKHEFGAWAGIILVECLVLMLGIIGILLGAFILVDMIKLLSSSKKN